MNRDQKAALVQELVGQLKEAEAVYAVDYRGISVSDAAALRTRLREAETVFRVVKNSLTERATDAAGAEALKPMLQGPTALAFVSGDAALAAKALNDAARALGTLEFKGGLLNGSPLSAEDVQRIARLPALEVLHGQLVGTVAAPLSGLVRTLNALIAGLAVQLGQIAEQGLVSGEAPSTPEAEAPSPSEAETSSETDGAAAASDANASEGDDAPSEPQAPADEIQPEAEATAEPEPEAEAAPSEPESEASPQEPEPEPETAEEPEPEATPAAEDASASEALAPQAGADESNTEAHGAEEATAPADESEQTETETPDAPASEE